MIDVWPMDKRDLTDPEDVTLAVVSTVSVYVDERGALTVLPDDFEFHHLYVIRTEVGQARDMDTWHAHLLQTDRFICVHGVAVIALSDGLRVEVVQLKVADGVMLTIPPRVYHCLRTVGLESSVILALPTLPYDKDDEGRVPFGTLGVIPW